MSKIAKNVIFELFKLTFRLSLKLVFSCFFLKFYFLEKLIFFINLLFCKKTINNKFITIFTAILFLVNKISFILYEFYDINFINSYFSFLLKVEF